MRYHELSIVLRAQRRLVHRFVIASHTSYVTRSSRFVKLALLLREMAKTRNPLELSLVVPYYDCR